MRTNELPPLPDQRQLIHDLILQMHKTGLSPPEEEIVLLMEAQENCAPSKLMTMIRSGLDCYGFVIYEENRKYEK